MLKKQRLHESSQWVMNSKIGCNKVHQAKFSWSIFSVVIVFFCHFQHRYHLRAIHGRVVVQKIRYLVPTFYIIKSVCIGTLVTLNTGVPPIVSGSIFTAPYFILQLNC